MTTKGNTNDGSERRVIYSMNMSLDGFVETLDRGLDWVIIDEELHSFFNDQARETGAFMYGRRMYEVMVDYWPTADANPSAPEYEVDFARIWKSMPKVVFSKTLEHVEWNSRLVRGNLAEEIAKLKEEPGKDLAVGGATLASTLVQLDLIDEYRPLVHPVVLGGGTPFLPTMDSTMHLRLVETRTFGSGVVYLRYERETRTKRDEPRRTVRGAARPGARRHGRPCRAQRRARSRHAGQPAGRIARRCDRHEGGRRRPHPARHDLPHQLDDQADHCRGDDDLGRGMQAAVGRAGGPAAARARRPQCSEAARRAAGRHRSREPPDHGARPAHVSHGLRADDGASGRLSDPEGRERQQIGMGPPSPSTMPTPDEWIRRLGTLPLMHQPGEKWMYNTGSECWAS